MSDNSAFLKSGNAMPLLHAQAELGEGALWNLHNQRLYWVDIIGGLLHIYDPVSGIDEQFELGAQAGTVVPVADGHVLVALQTGLHHINTISGAATFMINPITAATIRFNDGKCDPSGRFWVGTLAMDGTPGAAILYRLDADGSLHEMLHGVSISNGIAWTGDKKTMYFNDTPTQYVQAFDYDDATGNITNRRIAIQIPESDGSPDGMTIDSEDKLWIAMWGAGCVNRYDPLTGRLLQQIRVPAPHTSSCALGGPGLKTLFITTARVGLDADQLEQFPLSGDLFQAAVDIPGVPANFYRSV